MLAIRTFSSIVFNMIPIVTLKVVFKHNLQGLMPPVLSFFYLVTPFLFSLFVGLLPLFGFGMMSPCCPILDWQHAPFVLDIGFLIVFSLINPCIANSFGPLLPLKVTEITSNSSWDPTLLWALPLSPKLGFWCHFDLFYWVFSSSVCNAYCICNIFVSSDRGLPFFTCRYHTLSLAQKGAFVEVESCLSPRQAQGIRGYYFGVVQIGGWLEDLQFFSHWLIPFFLTLMIFCFFIIRSSHMNVHWNYFFWAYVYDG